MKTIVYWKTKDTHIIDRIRKRYNIRQGMTVNGENVVEINDAQYKELQEVEKLGYIQIRNK